MIPRTISFILGVPLRDGNLLDGLLEGADITGNGYVVETDWDWLE